MKLKERLKVLENLWSSKRTQLANLEIARQVLVNEIVGIEANIKLLKELIKEPETKKNAKRNISKN